MARTELRPLSLGELLDRSFSYYRRHFWLFVGIMALPQLFGIAVNLFIQMLPAIAQPSAGESSPEGALGLVVGGAVGGFLIGFVIFLLVYAIGLGATSFAVSEIHLGHQTTVRSAYGRMKGKVGRLVDLIFSVLIRLLGVFILLLPALAMVGIVGGLAAGMGGEVLVVLLSVLAFLVCTVIAVVIMLRYGVSIPALVVENLSARRAMERSILLTKGRLGHVFLIGLLMTLVGWAVSLIFQGPFLAAGVVMGVRGAEPPLWLNSLATIAGGAGQALAGPLLMIPLALLYYDARVRKEGFDLQLMMATLDAQAAPAERPREEAEESVPQLTETSVPLTVFLTFITFGLYYPIWFLTRRRAFNHLKSSDKIGVGLLLLLFAGILTILCVSGASTIMQEGGEFARARQLQTAGSVLQIVVGITLIVQCFRVRGILSDHFEAQRTGMFSASISLEGELSLSVAATFFLGIWYLQYKINKFLDLLSPSKPPIPYSSVPPAAT